MVSAWEVSRPWAVTTNTTMTATSETLCHTHNHTTLLAATQLLFTLHFRQTIVTRRDVSSHWPHGFQKEWLEWTEKTL